MPQSDAATTTRRRRSDARRSVEAIISSARALLSADASASMDEIAAAAGVARQTVYAHFPSREALVTAIVNAQRADGLATLEAAGLEDLSPVDAVHRFLDISWEIAERFPLVLDPSVAKTPGPDGSDPHDPVGRHLERIIERGQQSQEFDRLLPASWLSAATFGLGHAAAEEIGAGRLTQDAARDVLRRSVLRLYGADASR